MKKKKHIKYLLRILICTFTHLQICIPISAQQNKIDSISTLLKTDKEDTNKINHLNSLAMEFRNDDPDTSIYFARLALKLAEEKNFQKGIVESNLWLGTAITTLGNYTDAMTYLSRALDASKGNADQKITARIYNNIGNVYTDEGNYSEALKNHEAALEIRKSLSDSAGISTSYNNIGNVYNSEGDYPEALKNYFASLKIREAIGDQQGIADCYNNIGIIYDYQGNYSGALNNYFISLKIEQEIGDKWGIASSYNNIGNAYKDQGDYQAALKTDFESLKIVEEIGDQAGEAYAYNNIGSVYSDLHNYPDALKNYFAAVKIREAISDTAGMSISYNNIGGIFIEQNKFKEAEEYLFKARDLAKKIGNKEYLRDAYNTLTQLYKVSGNYKSAFENNKLFILYRDSIDNEETRKKTIQSQMTFDFEKKEAVEKAEHKKELENQSLLSDEKSRRQNIVIAFVVGGLLLVAVFAGFILRSLRVTRKQKSVIENQKHLVEEKQKEVLDSIQYAKRIQQSLLPTEKYIEKNLNRLKKG